MVSRHRRRARVGRGDASSVPLLAGAAIDHGIAQGRHGSVTLRADGRDRRGRRGAGGRHRAAPLRRVRPRVARRDRPPHAARRAPPAAALRVPRPGADRPADGATRTPTSSRSTTSCCSIPLTIASTIQMVAVVGHPRAAQPGARVLRARRAAVAQHLARRGSATACIPVGLAAAGGARPTCRASSRRASPASAS